MVKLVGTKDRSEFVTDPAEAWRRGRALDRRLAATVAPRTRGVIRATHTELNRMDDRRALEIARRMNSSSSRGREEGDADPVQPVDQSGQ